MFELGLKRWLVKVKRLFRKKIEKSTSFFLNFMVIKKMYYKKK